AVRGNFRELLLVKRDVVVRAGGRVRGRALLHLIRADIDRLNKSPLKPSGGAVGFESALLRADSCDCASHGSERSVAGSARFLVIDAKVRVVRQKIELVAEALDHRATQIAGIRQRVIVKSFVEKRKGTVLWLERRQMHFRIV